MAHGTRMVSSRKIGVYHTPSALHSCCRITIDVLNKIKGLLELKDLGDELNTNMMIHTYNVYSSQEKGFTPIPFVGDSLSQGEDYAERCKRIHGNIEAAVIANADLDNIDTSQPWNSLTGDQQFLLTGTMNFWDEEAYAKNFYTNSLSKAVEKGIGIAWF